MRVVDVRVHVLASPLAEPFAFSQGWVKQRSATLVEVVTDDGVTGWGEAFAQGLEPPEIAAVAIDKALRPLILGANPLDTEVLWHRMYHMTRDYGRKGSVVAAISAVDIALWDIAGKVRGAPVHALLGGAFRTRVQPYATGFYRIRGQGEAARLADEALRHFASGFALMKVKLGYGVDDDLACMEAVARAIQGKPVRLMVDTNHAYGRADALRLGRALDAYDLRWYEEPVAPEDLRGYAELRSKLSTPIAGGENEHTLYGFRELLAAGAVDIAQPDVGSCGGITAMRHIAVLAQSHGVQLNPHVWGSAIAQAASLQVIAALPVAHHSLYAPEPVLEYDRSSHPFREELVAEPVRVSGEGPPRANDCAPSGGSERSERGGPYAGGWVEIPSRPGLGIEVNRETVERYKVN